MELKTNFEFEQYGIGIDDIASHAETLLQSFEPIPHKKILSRLLDQVAPIDYRDKADLKEDADKLQRKHYIVISVDEMLETARNNNWKLCRNNGQTFIYNGVFWKAIDRDLRMPFLAKPPKKWVCPA